MNLQSEYIINLNKVSMDDLLLVGGKNASLGEMIQNLVAELLLNSNIKNKMNTFFSEMLITPKDEFKLTNNE